LSILLGGTVGAEDEGIRGGARGEEGGNGGGAEEGAGGEEEEGGGSSSFLQLDGAAGDGVSTHRHN